MDCLKWTSSRGNAVVVLVLGMYIVMHMTKSNDTGPSFPFGNFLLRSRQVVFSPVQQPLSSLITYWFADHRKLFNLVRRGNISKPSFE